MWRWLNLTTEQRRTGRHISGIYVPNGNMLFQCVTSTKYGPVYTHVEDHTAMILFQDVEKRLSETISPSGFEARRVNKLMEPLGEVVYNSGHPEDEVH